MSHFFTQPVNLSSDDPFGHVEQLSDILLSLSKGRTAEVEDEYPVTETQTAILRLESSQWCKVRLILPHNPPPTLESIRSTWQRLASHHACLRTVFYTDTEAGQVRQRVMRKAAEITLSQSSSYDSGPSSTVSSAASPVTASGDDRLPFLSVQQKLTGIRSVSLHIRRALVDSHSLSLLKANFYLLYCGYSISEAPSFKDYSRFLSKTKHVEESHKFWSQTLEGIRPNTLLDYGITSKRTCIGSHMAVTTSIDDAVIAQLPSFEHKYMKSRRVLFESLWAVVLSRHTRSEGVVFGSVGRDEEYFGAKTTIGNLEHVYPVRAQLNEQQKFGDLMTSIESYHRLASAHGYIGYDNITKHLDGAVVETVVHYTPDLSAPSRTVQFDDFPLRLSIYGNSPVRATLCVDERVDEEDAKLLLSHFTAALQSSLSKIFLPNALVDSIELETESQKSDLIASSHSLMTPRASTIPRLFEQAVNQMPHNIALEDDRGSRFTFDELNRIVNRLVRVLKIVSESIVVVRMDRTVAMMASLLAILKSGAAYTILDPTAPKDRNDQIIDDCKPSMILTEGFYADQEHDDRNFIIDDAFARASSQDVELDSSNLKIDIGSEQPCYVIYTSGSTGKPKGVLLSHRAATNGMAYNKLSPGSRSLLFYNPTFSAAQRTMLSTLVRGGTVVVPSKSSIEQNLAACINELRVDVLGITPSALSMLKPSQVPNLKTITLVGEQISQDLVETWAERVDLRSTYGLSECTQLNFGARINSESNPRVVGRPADTTSAFILKPGSVDPCPRGVAGELCLGGPQLGERYLNMPELTSAVFVDNPFGHGKLYRTGDLARMDRNGMIEILGRIDFQIKINGQKVEPAEIDRVLLQHSSVSACLTVSARINNRPVLVSGVVPVSDRDWHEVSTEVREHVKQSLPRYMVPSFWIRLERIKTNINGKSDRASLRKYVEDLGMEGLLALDRAEGKSAITNPLQQKVAAVWAQVLEIDVDLIYSNHSFVSLGGSSIQAIRCLSELAKEGFQATLDSLLSDISLEQATLSYKKSTNPAELENIEPFSMISDSKQQDMLKNLDSVQDAYPATPLQESLLPSLLRGEPDYMYQRVWDVSKLDLISLKQSVETVFSRSDILRTTFSLRGKSFFQLVRSDLGLPWIESTQTLEEYLPQDLKKHFGAEDPLVRFAILSETLLVVTMHHTLFDFWSHRFLYEDIAYEYLKLPQTPRPQLRSFVHHLFNQSGDAHRRFFQSYLKNVEPTILNHAPLPLTARLEKSLNVSLSSMAKKAGLTAGVLCYTAWAFVLFKHTGNTDVLYATTISGREAPLADIGRLDGPTLTNVPQRIQLDPNDSITAIAKNVRSNFLELLKHSQVGMRTAVAATGSHEKLFDTMVNFLVKDEDDHNMAQIFTQHGKRPVWTSSFTTLEVEDGRSATTIRISGAMEERRLGYILESFVKAVETIAENPEQKLSSLDLIGTEERQYLTDIVSNRKSIQSPQPTLLHSRFEDWARLQPDRVAIDWRGDYELTYQQLNQRANRLAHELIQQGVTSNDLVPLMLDKSVDTIVSILGVMKAGAGYVPLSPDNPIDRNLFIVKDVAATIIIAHKKHAEFCNHHNLNTLFIDEMELSESSTSVPARDISPIALAYVIYTSGSTGLPKGVKVPHHAASSAVESMMEAEGRHQGEWRTLQFANYVFDASVQDIFNTLSSGGTLCMAPTEDLLSDLAGSINAMSVKQAILTPTVARLLEPKSVPGFTTLIVGGEPLPSDVVEMWLPGHTILNVYGPTETSMVVTQKRVEDPSRTSNIGAPFPTVMAFIVQPDGTSLVPYGSVGELCVAGPQVTDGYVGREDLTAAAFVNASFFEVDKMYRTGDLARWLPNGEIECLGRKDTQVKLHGHRIELGEIEQAIRKTAVVQDTVVSLAKINGKSQLIAFCVFEAGLAIELISAADCAAQMLQLKEKLTTLTPYMRPAYVLPMTNFPKLPSRKVDRKALKSLGQRLERSVITQYSMSGSGQVELVVPVENELEAVLEIMWSEVLDLPVEELGREANFQTKGGDSIAAISLSSHARKQGYLLGVNDILRHPQLSDLAAKMKTITNQDTAKPARVFQAPDDVSEKVAQAGLDFGNDVEYVYPCPPGQVEFLNQGSKDEQMWVLMASRRLPPSIDVKAWINATIELTRTDEILRTTYLQISSTEWIGVVLKSTELNLQTVQCGTAEAATEFVDAFWHQKFTFGKPFIKYAMIHHEDGSTEVVIKMDHAVYDGTSLRVFDEHFKSALNGTPVPEHTQFKDFAMHTFESDKDASLKFWVDTINCERADNEKPSNDTSATNALVSRSLHPTPKITAKTSLNIPTNLDALSKGHNITPSTLFQAAYQIWLHRHAGTASTAAASTTVSFDYLVSGRNITSLPDPQSINGTLATFLPVYATFPSAEMPSVSLVDWLQDTQDAFWTMTEHANVNINEIYTAAGLDRAGYGNQSLFLFQPFEPAAGTNQADIDAQRWLVMAKSKVRMYQPYALVVEVAKAVGGAHRLNVMFDETAFSLGDAERIARDIDGIVSDLVRATDGKDRPSIQRFLEQTQSDLVEGSRWLQK